MTRHIAVVSLMMIGVLTAGCNTRTPILDSAVSPTTPSANVPPVPSPPPISAIGLELQPRGGYAGTSVRGTVTFNSSADGVSTAVITSSSSAVDISPSRVTAPKGAFSVDFVLTPRQVATDTRVTISASFNGITQTAPFDIWAVVPMFYSFSRDGDLPQVNEPIGRFTTQNADFHAYCYRSQILGEVLTPNLQERWIFSFGAPDGTALRAGTTYPNATYDSRGNYLFVLQPDKYCNPPRGSFTVRELEFGPGQTINKFWVTFEQSCQGSSGVLRGELRLTNVRLLTDATPSNCFR